VKPLKVRLEVVFPRDEAPLTVRLERGTPAAGGAGAGPRDYLSVETRLWQAVRLLAECELYESAACLRREMASRLGMDGGDEDQCEGRGP
jgi:hypothetical protein